MYTRATSYNRIKQKYLLLRLLSNNVYPEFLKTWKLFFLDVY